MKTLENGFKNRKTIKMRNERKQESKMERKEAYDMCFRTIKDLTYTCKRCKIKASFSMHWFKKNKLKEFNKRFDELWEARGGKATLGDLRRLNQVVFGERIRYTYFDDGECYDYRWKDYDNYSG